ncbi:MAG: N-acetylmuramoyl-L-alanine amidase [Muribaculaceae bacterium]|nr:N-acetylmuramoyl-L-alanine amidase [Muribaculaceae bacterium]
MILFAVPLEGVAKNSEKKVFTLVVDPGHGGKDIGATDNNAREKDINLGVALQLESLIKKKLKDAHIVMTRNNDTYLTLQERADVANKAKGDLFISIHTNSVDKSNKNRKTVAGSSVYALGLHKDDNNMAVARRENSVIELEKNYEQKYSGFDPSKDESYIIFEMAQKKNLTKSIKFAEMTQKQLTNAGRSNRGVHQAGFWVLWATSMPSVLIELDFICNPTSAKYLTSEKGQKELAEAIFKAVEAYYEDWKHMQGNAAMTKSMAVVAQEASAARDQEENVKGHTASGSKVKTSSRSNVKKEDRAPAPSVAKQGKRRRRSDSAKLASASRNVETKAIPLHSSAERSGKKVEEVETFVEVASVEETPVDSGKGKKKNKKDKKNKKEKNKDKDKNKNKEKKEKGDNKKKDRPANSHNAKVEKFVTVYKIQILASADLLKQNNPRFRGLSPITTYKENNLYKYYFGETSSQEEINTMLKEVKKKIPDAFIVTSKKMMNSSKN